MQKSTFKVSKMDCPSEERMIRMKLQPLEGIKQIEVDLSARLVQVYHEGDIEQVTKTLESLRLDSKLLKSQKNSSPAQLEIDQDEEKTLKLVLGINLAFFFVEVTAGFIIHSMGVVADGLDMFADAVVYGLSLYAIGRATVAKKSIVKLIAYLQLALASFGLIEVIRRFIGFEETPLFAYMILISIFALAANVTSLVVLQRSKSKDVHIKASELCTSNDVLANIGVILAAVLVYYTQSSYPDLIIGSLIFFMVARGSYKIMQLSK
ncbi:MAG: cation transporter [Patescibacteria group bacterium]|jgi:Co/Zn/Cd efflux system component